jgi:hypothetical protein
MPRGSRDRSLLPVPRPRSPSNHRPAQPQDSAPPAREPNLHFSACSRLSVEAQIKPSSTESEADPEIVRRAGLRRRRASHQRSPSFLPFPDGARSEPGLAGNDGDRVSCFAQTMDLVEDALPRTTMGLAGQKSVFCDVAPASWTRCGPDVTCSSLDSGNKARPVGRSARLSWASVVRAVIFLAEGVVFRPRCLGGGFIPAGAPASAGSCDACRGRGDSRYGRGSVSSPPPALRRQSLPASR